MLLYRTCSIYDHFFGSISSINASLSTVWMRLVSRQTNMISTRCMSNSVFLYPSYITINPIASFAPHFLTTGCLSLAASTSASNTPSATLLYQSLSAFHRRIGTQYKKKKTQVFRYANICWTLRQIWLWINIQCSICIVIFRFIHSKHYLSHIKELGMYNFDGGNDA